MNTGPLSEEELEWLDDVLMEYGNDNSVLDVSELDGMLTAILSGPTIIPPSHWLTALWGGKKHAPRWSDEHEMTRFMNLIFQHMNDIAERLCYAPDQFAPLFGYRTIEDKEYTIVEEWCFGYMRGVALDDWSALPESLQPVLDAIALHGREENLSRLEQMTQEEFSHSQAVIGPAALQLHRHWLALRLPASETQRNTTVRAQPKASRNDPCPCGSGKKFKHCCLH